MPKYFLYARKSTDEEDRQVLSIESQINELREFAKKEDLEVVDEFSEAKTAKSPGRPIFGFMLKQLEADKADGILAWHPDRLARNSVDGGKIIYFVDIGVVVDLRFPTYRFDNTAQGKFMLSIAFGQSKYYVDNLSENVKRGLREKLRRGEWPGNAPIGYINDLKSHNVVSDPERAPFVRKLFELYSSGNHSITSLYLESKKWGLTGRLGKPIRKSGIEHTLRNPFYYGIMIYKGETYMATHPPLISKKLFDQVQVELKNHAKPVKHGVIKYTFLGLMKCGECGASITAEKQKGHIYYRCTKKIKPCSQQFLREEALLEQINKALLKIFIEDKAQAEIFSHWDNLVLDERKASSSLARQLEVQINGLDAKIERLIDLYLDQKLSQDEYNQKKAKLLNQKKELDENLGELKISGGGWLEPSKNIISLCNSAGKVAWQGNLSQKRDFLKKNGSNLLLKDQSLSFYWLEPLNRIAKIGAQNKTLRDPRTKRIYASAKVTWPIYLKFRGQSLQIIFGEPPYNIKTEERITEKMIKEAKPIVRRRSPLEEALRYAEVYSEPSVISKTQVAERFGVSRARVCQILNLMNLDHTIQKYLLSIQDAREHNYFTERRLRQIAILDDSQEQIREFGKLVNDARFEMDKEID